VTVSATVIIGGEAVDVTRPCDVLTALTKTQLRLASGGLRETVRIDGEEVTFQRASDRRLAALIAEYRALCPSARAEARRTRFAKGVRWI
jgi:hypothetical protein